MSDRWKFIIVIIVFVWALTGITLCTDQLIETAHKMMCDEGSLADKYCEARND